MKIGLETESLHLWFQNHRMDIFDFIDFAHQNACDGVVINIIKDYGLDEEWGTLGSDEESHLHKIRERLQAYEMYCEIDAKGFDVVKFQKIARVAKILDAQIIRSYVPLSDKSKKVLRASQGAYDDSKIHTRFDKEEFLSAAEEIKKLIPILEDNHLMLAIENHEYQTSRDLLDLLSLIKHKNIGFLYDFGNSMMAYEDPIQACLNMAPFVLSTHCKDHIVFEEDGIPYVCGVPLGEGSIDIKEIIIILKKHGLRHINLEQCFPYCATFKRERGTGGVNDLTKGAFVIKNKPFLELKAMEYYYPQEVSKDLLNQFLDLQKEGCKNSLAYLKKIINEI